MALIPGRKREYEGGKLEVQKVSIQCQGEPFDVMNVYNPCQNIKEDEFKYYMNQMRKNKIIVGDFNAHHRMIDENSEMNGPGKSLVQALQNDPSIALMTPNGFPTYTNPRTQKTSTNDLCLIATMLYERSKIKLLRDNGSDHTAVLTEVGLKPDVTPLTVRPRWKFKETGWQGWAEDLAKASKSIGDVQTAYNSLCCNIIEKGHKHFKLTTGEITPKYNKCWWSQECEEAVKKKKKCQNKLKKHPTHENLMEVRKAEAIVKRQVLLAKRKSWQEYCNTITSNTTSGRVWKHIGRLQNKTTYANDPLIQEGNIVSSSEEKAEILVESFAKKMNTGMAKEEALPYLLPISIAISKDNRKEYNSPITRHEVEETLGQLKDTSAGDDLIHNKFLKHLPPEIIKWLVEIFNRIFSTGEIPNQWREALVIAIKKPEKLASDPNSYRPISLLPALGKVFERIVAKRLEFHLETKGYLSNSQCGFRKRLCTMDAIARYEINIRNALSSRGVCLSVFFDLASAFDSVWHIGLLYKLAGCGIEGKVLQFIREYLQDRTIRLFHNGKYSTRQAIASGVPQGSVLSPLLFNVMIRDIPNLEGVQCTKFADDIAIYVWGKQLRDVKIKCQAAINKMASWASKWGLEISIDKTKAMMHTLQRNKHTILTLNGKNIEFVKRKKFLGMVLDAPVLSWSKHIEEVQTKVAKGVNIMYSVSHRNWGVDREMLTRLYKAIVRARMDYGCCLYDTAANKYLAKLDIIQNQCLRIIIGARKTTPIVSLEVEANIEPLRLHRKQLILNYYARVAELPVECAISATMQDKTNKIYRRECNSNTIKASFVNHAIMTYEELKVSVGKKSNSQLVSPVPPWIERGNIIREKFLDVNKEFLTSMNARAIFADMVEHEYKEYLQVFTDGSVKEVGRFKSSTAAAFIVEQRDIQEGWLLCSEIGIVKAELIALWKAVNG